MGKSLDIISLFTRHQLLVTHTLERLIIITRNHMSRDVAALLYCKSAYDDDTTWSFVIPPFSVSCVWKKRSWTVVSIRNLLVRPSLTEEIDVWEYESSIIICIGRMISWWFWNLILTNSELFPLYFYRSNCQNRERKQKTYDSVTIQKKICHYPKEDQSYVRKTSLSLK